MRDRARMPRRSRPAAAPVAAGSGGVAEFCGRPDASLEDIAIRSMLRKALDAFPRRPTRRLAACRLRQSARQRFGSKPRSGVPLARRGIPPRPSARRRATTGAVTVRRAVARSRHARRLPLPRGSRSCRCSGRPCRFVGYGAGPQIRCVAGPRSIARRGLFRLRGDPRPRHGSVEPFECRAIYTRHRSVTRKIFLAAHSLLRYRSVLRPVTTGFRRRQ